MTRTSLLPLLSTAALLIAPAAGAQDRAPGRGSSPPPPAFDTRIEVVGITPIHGLGLPAGKVAANVQVLTADEAGRSFVDFPAALAERAASVHLGEVQGGMFQPDVLFRGFGGSPLLGASEGLAVYQDGVRVNEPFGDTINWDALPTAAIASVNVTPGSNPLFGLNALGGALSIRTKNGFDFAGGRLTAKTGSFGRRLVQGETGGHGRSVGYFAAGSLLDENGWRDHSPSTIRRLFGRIDWRGAVSSLAASVTAVSNDLTGNGAAPPRLLDERREAVFTHPDRTGNDLALVTVTGWHRTSPATTFDGVVYYRRSRIGTFNGDAADDGEEMDAVNHRSRTRAVAGGAAAQMTRTARLWGRDNHLVAGAGLDAGSSRFGLTAEAARLTADRGTTGTGVLVPGASVSVRGRTVTGSVLVADAWSLTPAVTLNGSARVNWTRVTIRDRLGTALNGDHSFGRLNPSAGITWQVRSALNVFGSYAQSSRVPTPVELTCADPEDPCRLPNAFVSDPPLDQVVARTWEAGARGTAGGLRWSAAAFTTSASDDIVFVSSGARRGEGHFENVERTQRRGVEASLELSTDYVAFFAAYTRQRAVFGTDLRVASLVHPLAEAGEIAVEDGDRLPGVPAHVAKLGLSAQPTAGLTLAATVRAQSAQRLRGDEANLLAELPGFAIVHVRGRQRITAWLSAVAEVQNVLDARYYTFGVLGEASLLGTAYEDDPRFYSPGAPRAAWVGFEVELQRSTR